MEFNVTNHQLCVGDIKITGVASSALFLIAEGRKVQISSAFDTPPESLIIGPFVPLTPEG